MNQRRYSHSRGPNASLRVVMRAREFRKRASTRGGVAAVMASACGVAAFGGLAPVAPAYTVGPPSPALICVGATHAAEVAASAIPLEPANGATVPAGTPVTFSGESSSALTFSVASSQALLSSPDMDSGIGAAREPSPGSRRRRRRPRRGRSTGPHRSRSPRPNARARPRSPRRCRPSSSRRPKRKWRPQRRNRKKKPRRRNRKKKPRPGRRKKRRRLRARWCSTARRSLWRRSHRGRQAHVLGHTAVRRQADAHRRRGNAREGATRQDRERRHGELLDRGG